MIRSFRHKGLKRFFEHGETKDLDSAHLGKLTRILALLDRARSPSHMDGPGLRLHPLKGARSGEWSVTVKANWRVTFAFDEQSNVIEVHYEDYH